MFNVFQSNDKFHHLSHIVRLHFHHNSLILSISFSFEKFESLFCVVLGSSLHQNTSRISV